MSGRRGTFLPVMVTGLASGAMAAVAAPRAWVATDAGSTDSPGVALLGLDTGLGEMPLASALSLVVLAGLGVLLVSRGRARTAVALLSTVAAAALLLTVVVALLTLPDQVVASIRDAGGSEVGTHFTGWFWAAAAATTVCLGATSLAVAWCRDWPEMGSRYDAPGGEVSRAADQDDPSSLELWKTLDEGRDPTA